MEILKNLFTECWWWLFLWMFLSFLLGWLLSKLFGGSDDDCCDELKEWKRKYASLENKFETASRIDTVPAAFGASKTKWNPYAKLDSDNLQIIEGIGPKMDEVMKKYSVGTWSALAGNTANDLRSILDREDASRYKIIDPTTWPQQAQLAVDGKWQELIQLQKDLDTGKTDTMGGTDSKLEKIMVKLGLLKKWKKDDLKAIEGVGPKIAGLLNNSGISTWKKLANTSVDVLEKILEEAGPRFKLADPGTWAKQAQLADEGKWEELQEYQDFLDGGK